MLTSWSSILNLPTHGGWRRSNCCRQVFPQRYSVVLRHGMVSPRFSSIRFERHPVSSWSTSPQRGWRWLMVKSFISCWQRNGVFDVSDWNLRLWFGREDTPCSRCLVKAPSTGFPPPQISSTSLWGWADSRALQSIDRQKADYTLHMEGDLHLLYILCKTYIPTL